MNDEMCYQHCKWHLLQSLLSLRSVPTLHKGLTFGWHWAQPTSLLTIGGNLLLVAFFLLPFPLFASLLIPNIFAWAIVTGFHTFLSKIWLTTFILIFFTCYLRINVLTNISTTFTASFITKIVNHVICCTHEFSFLTCFTRQDVFTCWLFTRVGPNWVPRIYTF